MGNVRNHALRLISLFLLVLCPAQVFAGQGPAASPAASAADRLPELTRAVRPWEFLPVLGQRAGLFAYEDGRMEAWVYPLKLFREFDLVFHVDGRAIPATEVARWVTVRPHEAVISYAGDSFSVKQTLFVPVDRAGAVLLFEVESTVPLQIEASFLRDFTLMWPASFGGSFASWDEKLNAYAFGEELQRFHAVVGSPGAGSPVAENSGNYAQVQRIGFRLPITGKAREVRVIALAASVESRDDAIKTYRQLMQEHSALRAQASQHYRQYLTRTVQLELPDEELQRAYDWSRISVLQGMVENPFLGTGLIAGYRVSGNTQRPGFAWFFGRDALWTSFAMNSVGDFSGVRTALEFLARYQRKDGKITHEIAQGANFVPWFEKFPYPWAAADATPLYLIGVRDYVQHSGDVEFARKHWDSITRALQFMRSTRDPDGFAQNLKVGHGWIEGGPLLPIRTELYQAGLGVEALRAFAQLAELAGQPALDAADEFTSGAERLNQRFWSPERNIFAWAIDEKGVRQDTASVLATVPMWFDLLAPERAQLTIDELSRPAHVADWGMRIIGADDPRYDPSGYHFGSVWPLFTGWASLGEYRYHRAHSGLANLRANAMLAGTGSLGHVTEVLSGNYFEQLSTSSPHQIWSAAMMITPLMRGLLGIEVNAPQRTLIVRPHIPGGWDRVQVNNILVGEGRVNLTWSRWARGLELAAESSTAGMTLQFSPSFSLRARVRSVEVNGRRQTPKLEPNAVDQHAEIEVPLQAGTNRINIVFEDDFQFDVPLPVPNLAATSQALKLVRQRWSEDGTSLTIDFAGVAGHTYRVPLWNTSTLQSASGAELGNGKSALQVTFPPGEPGTYSTQSVTLRFSDRR